MAAESTSRAQLFFSSSSSSFLSPAALLRV
jgi:hypothetical protein